MPIIDDSELSDVQASAASNFRAQYVVLWSAPVVALILLVLKLDDTSRNLVSVRDLLMLTHPALTSTASSGATTFSSSAALAVMILKVDPGS